MTPEDIALSRKILSTSMNRLNQLTSQVFDKSTGAARYFFNNGPLVEQRKMIVIFANYVDTLYQTLESPEKISAAEIHGRVDRVLSVDIDDIGKKCMYFFPNHAIEKNEALELIEVIVKLFEDAKENFYLTICASDPKDEPEETASLRI